MSPFLYFLDPVSRLWEKRRFRTLRFARLAAEQIRQAGGTAFAVLV